jgi:hypothetical protein
VLRCLGFVVLSACYGHTDFVRVEPVYYVPPPAKPIPNTTFGWVETTTVNAQGFRVRVGDLTYQRIIEPLKKHGEVTTEQAAAALDTFAVKEVVARGLCREAFAPPRAVLPGGFNNPPETRAYVECRK